MRNFAFTMAEILISLTIIGIIAAITLPALQSNINEKTWATQRKALYSRMTQAISMMPALNGYGVAATDDETNQNATQTFIAELGKTLRINNVCDQEHLRDCGISQDEDHRFKINNLKGNQISLTAIKLSDLFNENQINPNVNGSEPNNYDVHVGGFETANGEHILVYYNPYCIGDSHDESYGSNNAMHNKICANFIYDLNGTKGPNTVGKDIGLISALYSSDSVVVAPMPLAEVAGNSQFPDASTLCRNQDEDSRLPNLEEAIAIRTNITLFNHELPAGQAFWTNKTIDSTRVWLYHSDGVYTADFRDHNFIAWCVKR